MIRRLAFVFGLVVLWAAPGRPQPKPDYMKLKLGDAVEISGRLDKKAGLFVADNIEKLPEPRRPKLRGAVSKVLAAEKSFVLLGMKIKTDNQTEYLDNGGGPLRFESIRVKTRLEVTCRVDERGGWTARKIEAGKLKPSDKIKGTVTRLAFDGTPPDTFEISGMKILVTEGTDLYGPWGGANLNRPWAGYKAEAVRPDAPRATFEKTGGKTDEK